MTSHLSYEVDEAVRSFSTQFFALKNKEEAVVSRRRDDFLENYVASRDKITAMETEKSRLKQVMADQQARAEMESQKVDSMQQQLLSLEAETENIPQQISVLRADQESATAHADALRQQIGEIQEEKRKKINELTKGTMFYKNRLGLEFVRDSGRLRLNFIYIDPQRPMRKFTLVVSLQGQSYQLLECEPAVPQASRLLAKLNRDNDLAYFVQAIRMQFKLDVLESQASAPLMLSTTVKPSATTAAAVPVPFKTPNRGRRSFTAQPLLTEPGPQRIKPASQAKTPAPMTTAKQPRARSTWLTPLSKGQARAFR